MTHFIIVGPNDFQTVRIHMLISIIIIFLGFVSFAVMLLLTKKKSNIFDERDELIQKKSSTVGLMLTGMFVFVFSMILYVYYSDKGSLEVAWVWLIAYSTFSFAYFITSLISVYLYVKDE
jgi:hypothetical protein